MKTTRVKPWVKVVGCLVAIVAIIYGMNYFGAFDEVSKMFNKPNNVSVNNPKPNNNSNVPNKVTKPGNDVINISLDEWVGWKAVLDANGGEYKTKKGSIFDQKGITVNINIINDASQSSNALISGELQGAGYTVNRYAFLMDKFNTAKVPVTMPLIINSSTGGDGIIAKNDIDSVEKLVGKKIGVPRYSEAQTLVEWLLAKSSLTEDQKKSIEKVYFDTPDEAAKAFFAKKLDAAATWQPYISQAQETTGARVLFSTKAATNIILDGIVFRKDYIDANPEKIEKFVEGVLEAGKLYNTNLNSLKIMPLFANESDENIKAMLPDATLSDYTANKTLLDGIAQSLFSDMSNIWKQLGEKADPKYATAAFDNSVIKKLAPKFAATAPIATPPVFTAEQRETAKKQDNTQALLKQTLTISFEPNVAVIKDESLPALNAFADTAKILNGSIIQIEGNVANVGASDPELEKRLSEQRAKSVATYLQSQGVDASRFVIIGNGINNQIAPNDTPENQVKNRRTDIFFKLIEK